MFTTSSISICSFSWVLTQRQHFGTRDNFACFSFLLCIRNYLEYIAARK